MAVDTRQGVRQDLRRLEQAVEEATADPDVLVAVRSVLRAASEAVQGIQSRSRSGAYEIPVLPERARAYFPITAHADRTVTPEELRTADTRWGAALERGQRYRQDALAQVGPVLTPGQVAERLGVSTVTVNNWRRQGKLLALRFDDHQYLYPLFQFAESPSQGERGVLRHLDEVLAMLGDASAWEKARFFLATAPPLGGRTPLDVLRMGSKDDVERLRALARHSGELGS